MESNYLGIANFEINKSNNPSNPAESKVHQLNSLICWVKSAANNMGLKDTLRSDLRAHPGSMQITKFIKGHAQ